MKKILITGAAGAIGLNLIKYLLAEGKYEITALDLKNNKVYNKLKRYRKRINIIYGDVLDRNIIEDAIKQCDVIIHLSTCMPPFAEFNDELVNTIEYDSVENIIKALSYYNNKCHFIYASATGLNGYKKGESSFLDAKSRSENLIIKNVKKYTIIRVPLLLSDLRYDNYILNFENDIKLETLSKEDAAYAFCRAVYCVDKLNRKTINIGGGANCVCSGKELKVNFLKCHGLTFKYIFNSFFVTKNYLSPILNDSDDTNNLLNYRNDSLQSYFLRQKRRSSKRKISMFFAKPIINYINKKQK